MNNTSPEQEPTVYEACQEIIKLRNEIAGLTADNARQAEEIERLRETLTDIKIWAEGSTCEVCGKKKMTETDAYDYAMKALKQEEVKRCEKSK